MAEGRYIIYSTSNGYVENVIILDEDSGWQPPMNTDIEKIENQSDVAIGWTRISEGVYEKPEVLPILLTEKEAQAILDAQIAELEAKNSTQIG